MRAEPRLFVPDPLAAGGSVVPRADQRAYLERVMRLRAGDAVRLFNGRDGEWRALLEPSGSALRLAVTACVRAQRDEPGPCLAFAPIRRSRLEWLIEKAVELGAARLQPVETARSQAGLGPIRRLEAIVAEAAEQCGRLTVPPIAGPVRLARLAEAIAPPVIVLDPDATMPVASVLAGQTTPCLVIGPEGGLDAAERALLEAIPGVRLACLPGNVLRAETAALAALAVWGAVGRAG